MSTMTDQATENVTWPEPPRSAPILRPTLMNLRWWAEENTDPVAAGVDEQAVALRATENYPNRPTPSFVLWPQTAWTTTAEGKEYLGNVMRYKEFCARGRAEAAVDPVLMTPEREALLARISQLEVTNANRATTIQRMEEDFETIAESLNREAERRSWCSEYDEFVETVSQRLNCFTWPEREKEYSVSWTENYTVTVERSTTVTASSEEAALEDARENSEPLDQYSLHGNITSVEFDDDNDDYEAEINS